MVLVRPRAGAAGDGKESLLPATILLYHLFCRFLHTCIKYRTVVTVFDAHNECTIIDQFLITLSLSKGHKSSLYA